MVSTLVHTPHVQHNRLRDYKRRLAAVQEESKNLKREADIKSKKSKQWVDELQDKLREFRREKISWTNEAVALRGQVKDAQVCFKYTRFMDCRLTDIRGGMIGAYGCS